MRYSVDLTTFSDTLMIVVEIHIHIHGMAHGRDIKENLFKS